MNSNILAQKQIFLEAYNQLNQQQKEAVDEIYGPVMVIAGPGTGKTQLLAVRVCNILDKTDSDPSNILCLTYTDAGVTAMRNRLARFMGSDAYKVGIHTYHSFCNLIIRENPEKFSEYRDLANADELEIAEILVELINDLPKDHPNKRLSGEIYYDKNKWKELFDTMKKEGWSAEFIKSKIEEHKIYLRETSIYNRKTGDKNKGDFNERVYNEQVDKLSFAENGVDLISKYNQALKKKDRIDYNDSILFVLDALKNDESLRLKYQEKYQFVLADEYQDTNGTQNDLIFTLIENEFIDQPNIFVVGDDDQSIFRFQGANLNNIIEFKDKFDPKIVVLKNNYRSFQGILDSASTLIAHNKQRLTFKYPQLDKSLIESRKDHHGVGNPPQLLAFANPVNHNFGVVDLIRSIHARGVPYHEIAVIYQKHKEAEDIIKFLSYENIPISIKRRVNILPLKEIKRILTLLNYFVKEMTMPLSMDKELFEILHYDFLGNKPLDLAILSLHISKLPKEERDTISWRKVINDVDFLNKVGLKDPQAIIRSATIIEELFTDYNNHTIQTFFEMLMTKTGLYTNILLDSNKGWRLSVVNTFFDFIKKETANIPDTSLEDLLAKIDKMVDFDIALETNNIIYRNNGINFMTAHGSKGLEFEEVILLNTSQNSWKPTKSTNRVKFPDNMFIDDQDDTDEDYRRLFFVALTRAKNNVYLMYSKTDDKQKEVMVHQFVKELGFDAEVNPQTLDEEAILQYTSTLLKYDKGQISLIDKTLIDQVTENLVLNVTALNKYIKCPYTFYFENILRVPTARMATTGFGNAIHNALDRFIMLLEGDPLRKPPSLAKLLDLFADAMVKYKSHFTVLAYENHLEEGKKVCQLFYDTYVPSFTRVRSFKTELELNAEVNGVPIKGNIDRIDIYDDRIEVLDYKTGSYYSSDFTKPSNDNVPGKNWRQGVFYQILIEQDNDLKKYPVNSIFHYLKPSQNTVKLVEQNEGYKNFVKEEIVKVYQSIKAHEFDHGCGKSDCQWCNFVKEHGQ